MISNSSKRNTKQKFILIEFLKENSDKHLTADEICSSLNHENISQATIYRLLSSLTKEGLIKKIHTSENKPACYQYTKNECLHKHFHFVCTKCTKMYHFEDNAVNMLKDSLGKNEHFILDTDKTVFYGLCYSCVKGEKDE